MRIIFSRFHKHNAYNSKDTLLVHMRVWVHAHASARACVCVNACGIMRHVCNFKNARMSVCACISVLAITPAQKCEYVSVTAYACDWVRVCSSASVFECKGVRVRVCSSRVRVSSSRVRVCSSQVRVCSSRVRVCSSRVRVYSIQVRSSWVRSSRVR